MSRVRSCPWFCVVLAMLLSAGPLQADDLPALSLEQLFASPSLFGTEPGSPLWSPDSAQLVFSWNDAGRPERELWRVARDGSGLRRLPAPPGAGRLGEFLWMNEGTALLILRGDALWSLTLASGDYRRLGSLGPGASDLSLAPSGRQLAYLQNGDLWLFDLATQIPRGLTQVGMPALSAYPPALPRGRYQRPEREIGPGIWGGPTYAWAPDSQTIAVHHVDRRAMRRVPFPNYLADETATNPVRRGYPGDANELRQVGLLRVADGHLTLLDLQPPAETQVLSFSWSPAGVLLMDLASDTSEDRWLYSVTPGTAPRQLWHSARSTRIYTSFASTWHPDGEHVLVMGDLDDRYGLYVLDPENPSKALEPLSDLRFDVLSSPQVVAGARAVFFDANNPDPSQRQVFRVDLGAAKPTPERVTTLTGQHVGYPSPDGQGVAVIYSNDTSPPELYLAAAGAPMQRVTTSPGEAFRQRSWAAGRYVSFPSQIDGFRLHARILEPADLDPKRKYPVLFGPMYSNTVRNRWAGVYSRMQQLLVQKGYIVVQVDVRGSTGYGRTFREAFLGDFAGEDIEDIESTVAYLKTLPYVDSDRLGIWGSSYGGTLSVYTLLKKPGLFRAGVAAAAAVDPHFFGTDDVAIVRRPATHPEVFLNTAARYAANLQDHLLIIHGMQDQVVPFKTTAALADVLIREGKDFDFAFAAGATHGWSREGPYARYLFGKMLAHFDRYLTPAAHGGAATVTP